MQQMVCDLLCGVGNWTWVLWKSNLPVFLIAKPDTLFLKVTKKMAKDPVTPSNLYLCHASPVCDRRHFLRACGDPSHLTVAL